MNHICPSVCDTVRENLCASASNHVVGGGGYLK